MMVTKRCSICGRFRQYTEEDVYCMICGHDSLESECTCGRQYDYALDERNQGATLHCPKCGRSLRGRASEYDG
jgi:transcription elongation factor Elf1